MVTTESNTEPRGAPHDGQAPAPAPHRRGALSRLALPLGPALAALLILLDFAPEQPGVARMAAVAAWMAVWWIGEALPLAVTALLPVFLLPALGIADGKHVASQYVNHLIFLFLGGFIVAIAMQRWGLHRRIALSILSVAGVEPKRMLAGFMVSSAFLSMWISNTAAAMMMVAIALAVVGELETSLEREDARRLSVMVFLGVAYGCSIGGTATLVGTPPNLSLARIFAILYPGAPEISFVGWFAFAFPLSVAFLGLSWAYLSFRLAPAAPGLRRDHFDAARRDLGAISFEERVVAFDFACLVLLWITRRDMALGGLEVPGWAGLLEHPSYFSDGSVAIAAAVVLFVVPVRTAASRRDGPERVMDWDACRELPWDVVLLFGGGFALASGFIDSGLSAWLGERLQALAGVPPVVAVLCTSTLLTFMTELTSNTATTEMMLPVLSSAASAFSMHPLLLMVPGTLSCSCAFMLPVATPPNAIVFGSGRVRISDMLRAGLVLNVLGVVLITAAIFALGGPVLGIDSDVLPAWARETSKAIPTP